MQRLYFVGIIYLLETRLDVFAQLVITETYVPILTTIFEILRLTG